MRDRQVVCHYFYCLRVAAVLLFSAFLIILIAAVQGCGSTPAPSIPVDSASSQESGSQWLRFGVLLRAQRQQLSGSDGVLEPGMRMEIVLDDGRSIVVEQPVSQAGELHPGDRVRVLRIGGYSQVTFWPYQKDTESTSDD